MNILSHTHNSLFFSNTLYFTIYGALIMLLHDFHENAFDPKNPLFKIQSVLCERLAINHSAEQFGLPKSAVM